LKQFATETCNRKEVATAGTFMFLSEKKIFGTISADTSAVFGLNYVIIDIIK
jgi:hypothetical protein